MLPLQQVFEVRSAIEEYLKATFSFKDKAVHDAFYSFLADPEEGLAKGPYISLKLPFVTAHPNEPIPLDIKPEFPPYRHQQLSFERLSTKDNHHPQPTIITTGTSSGKTECFLYPLLDYCYQNINQQGIKAIILYPMNALATDQAKRLAEAIWSDDQLKNKITAGLFIGEGTAKEKKRLKSNMGAENIIETRDSIVASPPDILLTNFKMLDYALMKGHFDKLWTFNYNNPYLLRFLVLDELHTYDGAQGTDVANLIRRLKLKLNISQGQLCPIGTSATIGSGNNAISNLVAYASKVFGEEIKDDAVITEDRMTLNDFMPEPSTGYDPQWPSIKAIQRSCISENETYEEFIKKQKQLWQLDPNLPADELAKELKQRLLVRDLLEITSRGTIHYEEIIAKLATTNTAFGSLPEWDASHQFKPREQVLQSILALISEAKVKAGTKHFPFLYVQVQLWLRELSGLLRKVDNHPAFSWKKTAQVHEECTSLPPWFCRECGASGWLGVRHDNKPAQLEEDLNAIYEHFFTDNKNLYFLNTPDHPNIEDYKATDSLAPYNYLQKKSLTLDSNMVSDKYIGIVGYRLLKHQDNTKARQVCPECNTENSLAIIGTRVATLSSITISQVLSSNLDNRNNKERKILAFTNSVQDAAHQAGFVEARNYRFTFRSSLQQVINYLNEPVSLLDMKDEFIRYWKTHADESGQKKIDAYVYRFFPDDFKGKADLSTDYRDQNKQFESLFLEELDTRISWEIFSEFGINAQLGRTLEKTGASAIRFDEIRLKETFYGIEAWMKANLMGMIEETVFLPFINGLLHRMRIRGAVDHPYLVNYRTVKQDPNQLNWIKDQRHFLNRYFGSKSRFPRLLVTTANQIEAIDTTFTNSNNWYHTYFRKAFQLAPANNRDLVNEFYQQLLKMMELTGLVTSASSSGTTNYAIHPACVYISRKVNFYQCSHCNNTLQTTDDSVWIMHTPCLDYRCPGTYNQQATNQLNYYQRVYNRTISPRIYASEHTGLLPREQREDVETQFKERPQFNSFNTLVATSTLEMGINIGTLNTSINNSIPPTPANFLQRVGRAGRASGAALIANFATSKNHDLFHYEDPLGMMEGEVQTPGCFLEAREILSRHFMAFCMDDWAKLDPGKNNFPNRISFMSLMATNVMDPSFIINKFLLHVEQQKQVLIERFILLYKNDKLPESLFQPIREKLFSNEWSKNFRKVFLSLKDELLHLKKQAEEINQTIKDRQLATTDPEFIELQSEKRALQGIIRVIGKRSTYEHLTNKGILPNYAFPETGVKLQAAIRAFSAAMSSAAPVHKEFEIVRDAATALRELAPENDFYALGYRFHISGINTYNWNDPTELEIKRFCSKCDRLDNDVTAEGNCCPTCGDVSWVAASNKHYFVKLQAVKSSNKRHEAIINDSKEERVPVIYRQTRHLHFHADQSFGAKGMRDIPFGIEYVKEVDCSEINLGKADVMSSSKLTINGKNDVPRHGFITCRYCGRSNTNPNRMAQAQAAEWHYPYCKHKDTVYSGLSDNVFAEVFLYRAVKTEAIKILLPIQEVDSLQKLEMFKAGIHAGLRIYYKGNPDHIRMWDYQQFNPNTQRFDLCLVLYDSIPGGTGYLEKLFDILQFNELLRLAYLHIKECACQHKGNDGCYRCLFNFSNQYVQQELSRREAERLFQQLVERANDWEEFPNGLGALSGSGQIEESELEERFVRCLKNMVQKNHADGWHWKEERQGTIRYYLTIPNDTYTYTWQISPQEMLGMVHGVRYNTIADFLFTLVSIKENGLEIEDANQYDRYPKWAIYLDGYAFHASKEHLRFYTDIDKRLGIAQSVQYLSWTLTWEDLDLFDENLAQQQSPYKMDHLYPNPQQFAKNIFIFKKISYWQQYTSKLHQAPTSLDRLLWNLVNTNVDKAGVTEKATALQLAIIQDVPGLPSFDADELPSGLIATYSPTKKAASLGTGKEYLLSEASVRSNFGILQVAVRVNDLDLVSTLLTKREVTEIEKADWEKFWQLFNLVQKNITLSPPIQKSTNIHTGPQQDILQFYDVHLHPFVLALLEAGLNVNSEGDFYLEEDGFPHASASLGIKEKKIFMEPHSDEDRQYFLQAGYREFDQLNFDINTILS